MIVQDAKRSRSIALNDLGEYINKIGDEHLRYLFDLVLDQFKDTDNRILIDMVKSDIPDYIPYDPEGHYNVVYNSVTGRFFLMHGSMVNDSNMYVVLPPDYMYKEHET